MRIPNEAATCPVQRAQRWLAGRDYVGQIQALKTAMTWTSMPQNRTGKYITHYFTHCVAHYLQPKP